MQRRWLFLIELLCLAGVCTWLVLTWIDWHYHPKGSVEIKLQLSGAMDKTWLFEKDGQVYYQIILDNGKIEYLTPVEFTQRIYKDRRSRGYYERILNISAPIEVLWVAVGILGQVLFTGRMLVQWLASEKEKASVVPPVFWWMSLVGSTMLLVYFLWREDPVGVLGQAFGWFIYIRNLWLIYRNQSPAPLAEDPGPELGK